MSVVAAAVVSAAVVGAGSSYMASKNASKAAQAAADAQAQGDQYAYLAAQEQLDWAKKQKEDWDKIYGPVQDNLGEYYKTLSPEIYESAGVQKINEEMANTEKTLMQSFAQHGITNSGIAAAGMTNLAQTGALAKATVRAEAPQKVAQAKQGFLQLGLGQAGGINQSVQSSQTGITNVLSQQAANKGAQATQYNQLAGSAMAGVGTSIGSGISNYVQLQNLQQPVTPQPTWGADTAALPWG